MRVVLAVDGSFHSMYAVDAIANRPWGDNVRIRVVTAVMPPMPIPDAFGLGLAPPVISEEQLAQAQRGAERVVSRAAEVLRGRGGFVVEPVVRTGDPRTVILAEAESFDADLIVLGSQGLTGIKRLMLGSVAAYVASHAHCSVEIVRKKGAATPD